MTELVLSDMLSEFLNKFRVKPHVWREFINFPSGSAWTTALRIRLLRIVYPD